MPLYGWAGPGKMRPMEHHPITAPKIEEPAEPAAMPDTFFECSVCDKRFKKAMIAARHFNSAHSEMKVDKDTWRDYVKETSE